VNTARLRLEVRDFTDLTRWRWVLTDADGAFVKDHEVRLDQDAWQFEAFADLLEYLSWNAAPDNRRADEARIIADLGSWIGTEVLGPIAGALARVRPATVRVIVPEQAQALLSLPLELADAGGRPLAAQDVALVMDVGDTAGSAGMGVSDRLRVLGLFSLPEGSQPLMLRRERYSLVNLINRITAAGKAADVRVLQYGVTRDRLRAVLDEDEGWDIIHISGHGLPGELLLETPAGHPDRVSTADLADLLDPGRMRIKLVTVAASWSAARTADEQRRLLGIPVPDHSPPERSRGSGSPVTFSATLATGLATRLGCAILAMRYPVDDEFAIAFTGKLYDLLADKGRDLPRAVAMALRQLAAAGTAYPALSVATPTLFGGSAVDLRLAAPARKGPRKYDVAMLKMASFPPQPERFVGRTGVMAKASTALAPDSGVPGVVLHGMPGAGKTACALELAYGHEHAFEQLAWYKAPDEGLAIDGALTDFALTLEGHLPDFQMAHLARNADKLVGFLPQLNELMERYRLLIVIDNAESLLTESGQWRDERWGQVVTALTGHAGLGRVVVTTRRVPAGLGGVQAGPGDARPGVRGKLLVEAVDALSADEALLLARELPNLSALKLGKVPGIGPTVSRQLARNAITMARGHPKLLELAEGQAADPQHLASLVRTGDQAWRKLGGVPEGFFAGEETAAPPADYLTVLAAWTRAVADTLSPGERDLFWFLCCLEEPDRERPIVDSNWAELWRRLGHPGQLADIDAALAAIATRGLAAIRAGSDEAAESYGIHPGVAAAGRAQAGQPFRDAVDVAAAAYWRAIHRYASGENDEGSVHTGRLVRAGLASVPYYLRRQQWDAAAYLLEDAFNRDPSRANAAAVLPAIQQITLYDPRRAVVLARVLEVIDPAAAEDALRDALAKAVARGDHRFASVAAGRLVYLCRASGRLAEALHLAEQAADHTRRAGLGPWTQLDDQVRRLQVLNAMGQADQVLTEIQGLRAQMDVMPAVPTAHGPDETGPPWNVRETLLGTGRSSAIQLGQWAEALDLSAAVLASMRDRRAPATDIARTQFNDYYPLLRLGRTEEALAMLLKCRRVFQDAHDIQMLGKTLSALANAEDKRGRGDAAIRLQRDALHYKYLAGDVPSIAVSYHNLGISVRRARQPVQALASHLAAAFLRTLAGVGGDHAGSANDSARAAALDLREFGTAAVPPRDVADLCGRLAGIPGTDLPRLIAALSPDPETAEQVLRGLITQAQELAAAPDPAEAEEE
jgi:tetratricopeptide (TPR) repeat protein